jgi:hypothetical protein
MNGTYTQSIQAKTFGVHVQKLYSISVTKRRPRRLIKMYIKGYLNISPRAHIQTVLHIPRKQMTVYVKQGGGGGIKGGAAV